MALYQTYRPKTFDEVIGQDETVKICKTSLQQDKVPHALLLSGTYGTGKTTIARLLASGLCCSNKKDKMPCGVCPECVAVAKGEHPDCWEMDAASHRGVDDARKINERILHAPISAPAHILILDEAHMLTREAQNALLKTIEEPKNPVHIFLCTTEPHKILATIQSRCQRYPLQRPENNQLLQVLENTCKKEGVEYEKKALEQIAQSAKHSFRDALSILDQTISAFGEAKTEKLNQLLKTPDAKVIENVIELWQKQEWASLDALFGELQSAGTSWNHFTETLAAASAQKMVQENNPQLCFLIEACDRALQSSLPYPLSLQYSLQITVQKAPLNKSQNIQQNVKVQKEKLEDKKQVAPKNTPSKKITESSTLGSWSAARINIMMPLIALSAREKKPEVYLALRTVRPVLEGKNIVLHSKHFEGMPSGTREWIQKFGKCGVDWMYVPEKKKKNNPQQTASVTQSAPVEAQQAESVDDLEEIEKAFEEFEIVELNHE